jgi:AraC family transcriptional regulator
MSIEMTPGNGIPTQTADRIIHNEQAWFSRPADRGTNAAGSGLMVSRWTGFANEAREEASTLRTDCHVLGVALRPMDVTVFTAQKLIHDGCMPRGSMRVAEPGLPMRAIFRGGYDALHLHIPNVVIDEFAETGRRQSKKQGPLLGGNRPVLDPVIERLARALIRADDFGGSFGQPYAEGVGLAMVARFFGRTYEVRSSPAGARAAGLPKWRLKRATDYIAAHLSEPITLAGIAAATGLTSMHFAAQFRISTGVRPHEYLIRCRIERAQTLLAGSYQALVDVAFEVGFSTQAHFTTVFHRVVGVTPGIWRQQNSTNTLAARSPGRQSASWADAGDLTTPLAALVPIPGQLCRSPLSNALTSDPHCR